MNWIGNRFAERTSQAAVAVALTAAGTVATNPASWAPGALPLWLALVPTMIPCLITILVPEGSGATLASLTAPLSPAAQSGQLETKPNA